VVGESLLTSPTPRQRWRGRRGPPVEPFWRKDTSRADREGFGLGLAVARSLARSQGGDLVAEFHAPATLTMRLDLPSRPWWPIPPTYPTHPQRKSDVLNDRAPHFGSTHHTNPAPPRRTVDLVHAHSCRCIGLLAVKPVRARHRQGRGCPSKGLRSPLNQHRSGYKAGLGEESYSNAR